MAFTFPKASIVIATYNNAKGLQKVLKAMLALNYPNEFEVIVVDDGSKDGTSEMMQKEFSKEKKIKFFPFKKNQGVCRARNKGISLARFPIVTNMDHDCIPSKSWLKGIIKPFSDPRVGAATSFGAFGGTSTAFRKRLLEKVQGYDEDYFYYREDTDLTFKIMELGFEFRKVKADYFHDHKEAEPKGFLESAKYAIKRLRYHENDVLLYKKHPKLASKFLDIKLGFLVSPVADFKVVANLWEGSSKKMKLGSPRGITFIENKSPFHATAIILAGILYVFLVKAFRLWASIKFGKLLI